MSLRERTRPGPGIIVARNLALKPPISGAQLRAARALLKLSVRELSDQCGISQSAIARSESGRRHASHATGDCRTVSAVAHQGTAFGAGLDP